MHNINILLTHMLDINVNAMFNSKAN